MYQVELYWPFDLHQGSEGFGQFSMLHGYTTFGMASALLLQAVIISHWHSISLGVDRDMKGNQPPRGHDRRVLHSCCENGLRCHITLCFT